MAARHTVVIDALLELAARYLVPRSLASSIPRCLFSSVPRYLTSSVARWQGCRRAPSPWRLSIGPQIPMARAPLAVVCREHSVFL